MKKLIALLLALAMLAALAACGSKDALAGTWSAELGADGTVVWTFDGKGGCTMKNEFTEQDGTYTISGDQLTVKLELWDDDVVFTFSVSGDQLTMTDNAGRAVDGTFTKQ